MIASSSKEAHAALALLCLCVACSSLACSDDPPRASPRMTIDELSDLVASGDLDPAVPARMPTSTLAATELEWRAGDSERCVP